MNRWAARHANELRTGLTGDEELLVAARVALSRRTSPRAGFPAPARIFVLGLSERRLLLWRATRWRGRPGRLATSVALDQVSAVDVVRRLGGSRLRVTLASGPTALLEATWGGSLRALSDTFVALRHHR
ncbi:MAG TPA: hypothetical protein VGZ52_10965 [Acidimicrobiales bacterium]|nr:hypothetical protein [Acidimicrobiales bacterium]